MSEKGKYWITVLAIIFLGVTFLVAGVGKVLAGFKGFEPFVFPAFLPQSFIEFSYFGLSYLEIMVGGLLILGIAIRFAASLSAFLVACFIASNILMIYQGGGFEPCSGCFGIVGGLTAIAALAMDGVMATMAVVILICYQGSFFNISPWFLEKRGFKYANESQ